MEKRFYKDITQEPYCCVPTCIQMILYRRYKEKFSFLSQKEIGNELGLITPDKKISEKKLEELGVDVNEDRINKFFKKYNIPLQERFVKYNKVLRDDDFFLLNQLECNLDVIVGFKDEGKEVGHVSLVQKVETTCPFFVIMMDPSVGSKKIKFNELLEAIRRKEDGYWLIGTKEEHERSKSLSPIY